MGFGGFFKKIVKKSLKLTLDPTQMWKDPLRFGLTVAGGGLFGPLGAVAGANYDKLGQGGIDAARDAGRWTDETIFRPVAGVFHPKIPSLTPPKVPVTPPDTSIDEFAAKLAAQRQSLDARRQGRDSFRVDLAQPGQALIGRSGLNIPQ